MPRAASSNKKPAAKTDPPPAIKVGVGEDVNMSGCQVIERTIPVGLIVFVSPQDAPGASVKSSLTNRRHTSSNASKTSKHEMEFVPALQHFRLAWYQGAGAPPEVAMIPVHRAQYWRMLKR